MKKMGGNVIKMKVKIIMAILVLGLTCLGGCKDLKMTEQKESEIAEENKAEEDKVQAYRTPTERELEILEGCNISNDSMKKVKEKGMNLATQSFVDTAQIMLDYLEEKYEEKFEVVGGEIPGIISGDYMIFAQAVEGEYRGERFEVYYLVDDEGKGYCEDGYFAILKSGEMQEYLREIAEEAGTDIKVIASLSGRAGKEYDKDTTVEEIKEQNKRKEIQISVHGDVRPGMSEEEFQRQVQELEEKYRQTGMYLDYTVWRLVNEEKFDSIQSYDDLGWAFPRGTELEEIYDLRYDEYIRPEKE